MNNTITDIKNSYNRTSEFKEFVLSDKAKAIVETVTINNYGTLEVKKLIYIKGVQVDLHEAIVLRELITDIINAAK